MVSQDLSYLSDSSNAQRLRLRRALIAAGAGFANTLVMLLAWQLGYVQWSPGQLVVYLLIVPLSYLVFPLLIHFRYNLRCSDPSLTLAQIGWYLLLSSYLMYAAAEIRGLLIINPLLVMLFAVFRFHPRHLPWLTLLLLASYCLSIIAQFLLGPVPVNWPYELLAGLVFLLALVGVSLLGFEIANLRLILKRRNLHLAQAMARIEEMAVTDELTGLYNRRQLMRILQQQKGLADRGAYVFSIGFVDLDFFKQINDTYGHGVGDQTLVAVAQEIRRSLREVDCVARLGGEEFVLVLVQTDYPAALRTAERLRHDLEQMVVKVAEGQPDVMLTASIGIATYHPQEPLQDLMRRADKALYVAKGCGRNCIVGEQEVPDDQPVPESKSLVRDEVEERRRQQARQQGKAVSK